MPACSYLSLSPGLPSFPHCFYSLLFLCFLLAPPSLLSISPRSFLYHSSVFVVTCLCLHRAGSVHLCLGMLPSLSFSRFEFYIFSQWLSCVHLTVSLHIWVFFYLNLFLYFSIFISLWVFLSLFSSCLNLLFPLLLSSFFQSYYLISTLHQYSLCVCPLFFSCECEYVCVSVCICMWVCAWCLFTHSMSWCLYLSFQWINYFFSLLLGLYLQWNIIQP